MRHHCSICFYWCSVPFYCLKRLIAKGPHTKCKTKTYKRGEGGKITLRKEGAIRERAQLSWSQGHFIWDPYVTIKWDMAAHTHTLNKVLHYEVGKLILRKES